MLKKVISIRIKHLVKKINLYIDDYKKVTKYVSKLSDLWDKADKKGKDIIKTILDIYNDRYSFYKRGGTIYE